MGIGLAIGALASGIGAATTFSVAAGLSFGFSFTAAAVSFALGGLQSLLTPKPKNNLQGGATIKQSGVTQNVRQAITSRRTIYGECRVGGAVTFLETTSNDKYLHMVLTICDHEVEEIGEIWFEDVSIPADYIDGSGNVIDGTYSGKARIKKHLGTTTQTADSNLVSETSASSSFRGHNITYVYLRLEYDRDIYPGKIPVVTAFVKGKKMYDPRDAGTRYSANGMLFVNDYLTGSVDSLTPGVGVAQAAIDSTAANAAINVCDEIVTTADLANTITSAETTNDTITLSGMNDRLQYQTGDRVTLSGDSLPGGLSAATNYYVITYQRKDTPRIQLATSLANALAGTPITISGTGTGTITKTGEPRYFGGGIIETSEAPKQNLEELLTTSGGSATYIGGKWHFKAAAYATPVFTFDESHVISKIVVRPKVSRRDRFNLVKGVYVSPLNDGQTSDYPSVTNASYVSSDNGRTLPIDYDLPFTQRPHTAQRLAKIKLEKHRQEIFVEAEFKLHAMQVQPGDTIYLNNSRFGWTNKVFEVITWSLNTKKQGKVPVFYVKMSLQETASTVYAWNNGEETQVDPAKNTSLPNALDVAPPTGLAVVPVEIRTASGDLTYEFIVSWTPPADIFVVNGGYYDVQFKKTSATDWSRSFRAEDEDTEITVKQVEPGVNYDVRIRSVNNLGVRSQYQPLFGFTVDSPSGATIRIDQGAITGPTVETNDKGQITGSVVGSIDQGAIA